jgi:hypothetical protein
MQYAAGSYAETLKTIRTLHARFERAYTSTPSSAFTRQDLVALLAALTTNRYRWSLPDGDFYRLLVKIAYFARQKRWLDVRQVNQEFQLESDLRQAIAYFTLGDQEMNGGSDMIDEEYVVMALKAFQYVVRDTARFEIQVVVRASDLSLIIVKECRVLCGL